MKSNSPPPRVLTRREAFDVLKNVFADEFSPEACQREFDAHKRKVAAAKRRQPKIHDGSAQIVASVEMTIGSPACAKSS
jgi:hypothetical protein